MTQQSESHPKAPSELATYLTFSGNCQEALMFYADELDGTLGPIHTHRDAPESSGTPEVWLDKVMHGEVTVAGRLIMGGDAPPGSYQQPQGVYLQIHYNDLQLAEQIYNRLSDGGTTLMPFGPSFWAQGFGMLTDRFGIGWIVTCDFIDEQNWK